MILETKNLTLSYEKGNIRWIKIGEHEILRMIYPAIRDGNWGTIEAQIKNEEIVADKNLFSIKYRAIYKKNNIYFEADYLIQGKNNLISFEMNGIAKNDFLKNRIGLCILHPIKECAGKHFEVISPEGKRTEHNFPNQISPHQPAKNMRELNWNMNGIEAKLHFEGDIFEMEDQRNWTDASFKIYSTPLELPFPVKIKKNKTVYQKVTLEIDDTLPIKKEQNDIINIHLEDKKQVFPNIGFMHSVTREQLSENEINLLKQIEPGHIRGDIHFLDNDWKEHYSELHTTATELYTKLFLSLHFTEDYVNEVNEFLKHTFSNSILPDYILLLDGKTRTTSEVLTKKVFPILKNAFPNTLIGGGVDAYFAELNRSQLNANKLDFVTYSISPQVHATDDMSLIENLEGQKYTVESTKNIFTNKNIFVSPVSLKQRFNVVSTDQDVNDISAIDHRQSLFFNALWTLISIKYLSESGVDLITYFETTGNKGIIDKRPFPVYHVFEIIKGAKNLFKTQSSSPLKVDSICLEYEDNLVLCMVNFSNEFQIVNFPVKFRSSKKIIVSGDFQMKVSLFEDESVKIAPDTITVFQLAQL